MPFPEEIFDGSHLGRKSLSYDSSPTFSDYIAIVNELSATQRCLKSLVETVGETPDLRSKVVEYNKQLTNMLEEISKLELPDNLAASMLALETQMSQISGAVFSSKVPDELAKAVLQVKKLQIEVDKLNKTWDVDVQAFQKNVKGWMKAFSSSIDAKIDNFRQEIVGIIDKLDL